MGIMKVYAYKVSLRDEWTHSLESAFRVAGEAPLENRLRQLSSSRIRLEDVLFSNNLVFANFVLFRSGSGPAIVSDSSHLAEIDIQDDQYFGEDTACLYDPDTRYILIQYNHHGPKASAIQEYLSHQEEDRVHSYSFAPKLSESSERAIQNLALVSRVEVSFAAPYLTNLSNPRDLSFGQAVNLAEAHGANTMSLVIGNRKGLALAAVKELIVGLYTAASCGEGVRRLTINAQVDDTSPRETIDLIADRLCHQAEVPLGAGRRYSTRDRWSTMAAALRLWTRSGYLS